MRRPAPPRDRAARVSAGPLLTPAAVIPGRPWACCSQPGRNRSSSSGSAQV